MTAPLPPHHSDPGQIARGIASVVLAFALFSTMDAVVKGLRADYSVIQILFFRMAVAVLPSAVLVHWEGGLSALRTRRLHGHVGRTLLTLSALFCFFYAFAEMPLADFYSILYAAPLMITALGAPLLGERVGRRRWIAVLIGFAGVVVVLRPGGGMLDAGSAVALAGTVLYAFNVIFLRQLARTETNAAIVFYFTLVGMVVSGLALPFAWTWPAGLDWLWLVAVGLIGGLAQIFITQAYRLAPVAVISPFQYSQLLWGLAFGYLVFGDRPDPVMLLGAAIIVACGLYILRRETRPPPVRADAAPPAAGDMR